MPRTVMLAIPILIGLCSLITMSAAAAQGVTESAGKQTQRRWIGVHLLAPGPEMLPLMKRGITEALAPMGVNILVLEVNYGFQYQSHPELASENAWSKAQARELSACCRQNGIRLIPEFNCLGHQSWAKTTFPLLVKYPELDETPQIPKDNPNIYCRSWCPSNPKANEIVFALLDELIDAFQSDAFHVGMDEVFLIASEQCPRCKGKEPAELFARAVNDLHHHLVDRKKQTMLMWGDRLLDAKETGYGRWEASDNGTAPAIDRIPKDIVLCDWHYERQDDYPSLALFEKKGFRVWPSSWRNLEATRALIASAGRRSGDRMVGHFFTVWSDAGGFLRALLGDGTPPEKPGQSEEVAATLRACIASVGGKLPEP
jgi:hypothetical protein